MVKPIVTCGLRITRVVLLIVMIIGGAGVPFLQMGVSIQRVRADAAYQNNPSDDATRRAYDDANARDIRKRVTLMFTSVMICVIAAVGVVGVTVVLRGQTI